MDYVVYSEYDKEKNIWNVKVEGEIDIYNSNMFKETMLKLISEVKCDVHIDCKDLEYIDSTGLGALVAIMKNIKQQQNNLHLKSVKSSIMKIFRITDLDKIFIIEGEYNERI